MVLDILGRNSSVLVVFGKPRITLNLPNFCPFFRLDLQHLLYHLFASIRQIIRKNKFSLKDFSDYFRLLRSLEGQLSANHIEKNYTACPDVNCKRINLLFFRKDLGSHVFQCSSINLLVQLVGNAADSKIRDFDGRELLINVGTNFLSTLLSQRYIFRD